MHELDQTIREYQEIRIIEPVKRLKKRRKKLQHFNRWSSFIKIVLSAIIPVLASEVATHIEFLTLISVLAASISVIQGVNSIKDGNQEIFIISQLIADLEKNLFLFNSREDNITQESFQKFVEVIENCYSDELSKLNDSDN